MAAVREVREAALRLCGDGEWKETWREGTDLIHNPMLFIQSQLACWELALSNAWKMGELLRKLRSRTRTDH